MRVGTIYYNENTDTTEVKWADGFIVDRWLTKIDVLLDVRKITWLACDYVHKHHDNKDNGDGYIPQTLQG